jgi:hypothetical protein
MATTRDKFRNMVTRRNLIVAGGVGAVGVTTAVVRAGRGEGDASIVGDLSAAEIVDIGDGYVLADGWVLKTSDLPRSLNKDSR